MKRALIAVAVVAVALVATGTIPTPIPLNDLRDVVGKVDGLPQKTDPTRETDPTRADDRVPEGTLTVARAQQALDTLTVAEPGPLTGYDRECTRNAGCVFGTAWNDDVDTQYGRNGCDTRNDILGRDLQQKTTKPDTRGCKITQGTLNDPYTGRTLNFTTTNPSQIQIDHVVSLSQAWRTGAHAWTPQHRKNFANDPRNLLAVDGPTNQAKSDRDATWQPPNRNYRCSLARITITITNHYNLTITPQEKTTLTKALKTCPQKPRDTRT